MFDREAKIAKSFLTQAVNPRREMSLDNIQLRTLVFDQESKVIFVILILSQLFFPNGFYLFICLAVFAILFYYVQLPLKPAVFTLVLLNHFSQIISAVWQANYVDSSINFRAPFMSQAIVASVIGMAFLFFPIIYYQKKLPILSLNDLKKEAFKLSTANTLNCYIAFYFVASFISLNAFDYGGITQVLFSIANVKWLFFLLLGYQCILKNEMKNTFYAIVIVEFLTGFFSFFSAFKTVIYFFIVLFLGLLQVINIKKVIYGSVLATLLVVFALIWTGIKSQYRSFINEGSKAQVVSVSGQDALNKIYDLSSDVTQDKLNSSTYDMLDRLQYVYHFAKTIQKVPEEIPFENGQNWLANIEFVTTPRILNPDKPSIDATEKTRKYTGLSYAGRSSGASFSLGYFAECYIDFGFWGMMFPLTLLGLMYGYTYLYFLRNSSRNYIFNYAVVGSFFMEFFAFEMDGTYLLGRFLTNFVTYFLLAKFFFPWVMNYISVTGKKPAAQT
jgi:hypothetical protein